MTTYFVNCKTLDELKKQYRRLAMKYHPDCGGSTEIQELNEHYTGKQRREALARFEELRKQRPGIELVKDIEKRSWEK